MKTKSLMFLVLLIGGIMMTGCNSKKYRPDNSVVKAFNQAYPKAAKIEWEQKSGYEVAEFHDDGIQKEAWFDKNGKWAMTESKIKYNALPREIRNHFEKSIYGTWKKEDMEKIEQAGMKPIYVIEIEKEGLDTDLYYTEDGNLAHAINDIKKESKRGYTPTTAAMTALVRQKYPDATIITSELEKGKYEIDIWDNGRAKEVIYQGNKWESTSWKVSKSEVPTVVMEAYRKSAYGKYAIDDIHFIETPERSFYRFELEQGGKEVHLSIDQNGNVKEN